MRNYIFTLLVLSISLYGCGNNFPHKDKLTSTELTFIDQNSTEVIFSDLIKDKTTLIGFIFTNCPDICPMTIHNMHLAEQRLSEERLNNIKFISVSFDPNRDTPEVLTKFARVRNLNMNRWSLLTGDDLSTKKLMNEFGIKAFPDDTVYSAEGKMRYYFIHTDKIALIDKNGFFRKTYSGSAPDLDEIISDIKHIGD